MLVRFWITDSLVTPQMRVGLRVTYFEPSYAVMPNWSQSLSSLVIYVSEVIAVNLK